ncbi:hypothetical protein [Fulvivirga ligni]|uniref:hypothetical protein n=1 Tax=Fulvivirga ligni TaxID=2904246 RepID=UPI001F3AF2BD|nr:hypothetical protein [Fulvivirga ligni]UII19454.1 hypothetical protein LVD16_16565 [Fulvivirga ligni]
MTDNKYSEKYKHLSPVQQQFIDEKVVSTTMKIDKWLALLTKVSKFDKRNDDTISSFLKAAIVCFVLTFLSLFSLPFLEVYALIPIGIFLASGIVLLVYRKQLKKRDVNNYLRLFFIPVLNILRAKVGGEAKLSANLDFRIPRTVLTPVKSNVRGRDMKLYSPKYIVARLTMADNAALEFVVADDIKDFRWTKRSASGKTKIKTKTKFVHYCFVKLSLPKSEYQLKKEPAGGITVMDHNGHYLAKAKVKIKTVGKGNVLKVAVFLDTMQKIYSLFQPLNPIYDEGKTTRLERSERDDVDDVEDGAIMMAMPYLWYGSDFDDYDYDGFDYTETGDYVLDDDSVTAFDS